MDQSFIEKATVYNADDDPIRTTDLCCHVCKYSWLLQGFPFEKDRMNLSFYNHAMYCKHCYAVSQHMLYNAIDYNPFDVRLWDPQLEPLETFHCCGVECSLRKFSLSSYDGGYIPSFIFLYHPSHRLCEKCFYDVLFRRSLKLDPCHCCFQK